MNGHCTAITTLANRLIRLCGRRDDFEFVLRQTSYSGYSGLDAYLPPNLSLAETAIVTATILLRKCSTEQIDRGIQSQLRMSGSQGIHQELDLDLIERVRAALSGG